MTTLLLLSLLAQGPYPLEAPPLPPPELALRALGYIVTDAPPVVDVGEPVTIDVQVVLASGVSMAGCQWGVDRISQTARNSAQGHVTVRMVNCLPTTYGSSGSVYTDLIRFTGQLDGYLDFIHAERDRVGADTNVLITKSSDYCGVAYLQPSAISAFAVVSEGCLSNSSFEHEWGHNTGMDHDLPNGCSGTGCGWCFGNGKKDVLTYPQPCGGSRAPYFSNPDVLNNGTPTGAPMANNAQMLRERAPTMANFRSGAIPLPPLELELHATSDAASSDIRTALIQQIWGCPGLPTRLASSVTLNVGTGVLASAIPLVNVQTVDRYTIQTYAQTLSAYVIRPVVNTGQLSLVILGHSTTGTLSGGGTSPYLVNEALKRGNTVLLVPMPAGSVAGHDALAGQAYEGFSPLAYFLDGPIIALNQYLSQNPAPSQIVSMGVSGGGWTTVFFSALDLRVQLSVSIAGSLPLPLRSAQPQEFGDYEQRYPNLLWNEGQFDYPDAYLMAASDTRTHLQINNQFDACCFMGTKDTQYVPQLTAVNPRYTFTRVSEPGVHGMGQANVTALVGPLLGPVVVQPPITYTALIDNGDPGFVATGPLWFHRLDETNAYQGDIHHPTPCASGGTGTNVATWTFTGVPDADVQARVTWTAYTNRATNSPFEVLDGNGAVLASGAFNQKVVPTGITVNGKVFQAIGGLVRTTTGTLVIRLTDAANGCVIADAGRVASQ